MQSKAEKEGEKLVREAGHPFADAYPTTTYKNFLVNLPAAAGAAAPLIKAVVRGLLTHHCLTGFGRFTTARRLPRLHGKVRSGKEIVVYLERSPAILALPGLALCGLPADCLRCHRAGACSLGEEDCAARQQVRRHSLGPALRVRSRVGLPFLQRVPQCSTSFLNTVVHMLVSCRFVDELHREVDPSMLPRMLGGTLPDGVQWERRKK